MNIGRIAAWRFDPKRRWFWQKPDGADGLMEGGLVRCVVLHPEDGAPLPDKPDAYHAMARIVRLIGEPFLTSRDPECRYCGGPCVIEPYLIQRVQFAEP